MKIININVDSNSARRILDLQIPQFVLDVIRPLEEELLMKQHQSIDTQHEFDVNGFSFPIRINEEIDYENVANLVHTIPIWLFQTKGDNRIDNAYIDTLGAYCFGDTQNGPHIELYISEIQNETNSNDIKYKWLFTKVLLHELGHATLDINNYRYGKHKRPSLPSNDFFKWREESMANAVALQIIKESGNKSFYKYAKKYMLSQPLEYALGAKIKDLGYWDLVSVMDGKSNGVNGFLQQEWKEYVKHSPSPKGLHKWNALLSRKYVYLYKKKYYTEENELVKNIVKDR